MKSKLLIIIISAILAVSAATTAIVIVSKNSGDGPSVGGTSSSSSVSQSSGDSSQSTPDSSSTPPVISDPKPVERTEQSLSNLANTYLTMSVNDVLSGGVSGLRSQLSGYMVGDLYSGALSFADSYMKKIPEMSDSLPELVVNIISGFPENYFTDYFGFVYYDDGIWRDKEVSEAKPDGNKAHQAANEILCYKLDGSEKLEIENLNILGEWTIAQIFSANGEGGKSMVRELGISTIGTLSPIIKATFNMTLNQAVAILDGTPAERYEALVAVYGNISVNDIAMFIPELSQSQNNAVIEIKDLTVSEIDAVIKTEGDREKCAALAVHFPNSTVGDVIDFLMPEKEGGNALVKSLKVADVLNALAEDRFASFINEKIGELKLNEVLSTFVDAPTLSELEEVLPNLATTTVKDFVENANKTGKEAILDLAQIAVILQDLSAGDTASLNEALVKAYIKALKEVEKLPEKLATFKTVASIILDKLIKDETPVEDFEKHGANIKDMIDNNSVKEGDEVVSFNYDGFMVEFKAAYGAQINEVLAAVELDIDTLIEKIKENVKKYVKIYDEQGADALVDELIKTFVTDNYDAFVSKYSREIEVFTALVTEYIPKYKEVYQSGGFDALTVAILNDLEKEAYSLALTYIMAYSDVLTEKLVALKVEPTIIEAAKTAFEDAWKANLDLLTAGDYQGFIAAVYEATESAAVEEAKVFYADKLSDEIINYKNYTLTVKEALDLLVAYTGDDTAEKERALFAALDGLTVQDALAILSGIYTSTPQSAAA